MISAKSVSLSRLTAKNCCLRNKVRGFLRADRRILNRPSILKVRQEGDLSCNCNECIDSLAVLGTIDLRRPDNSIIQPTAADCFFGEAFGAPICAAIGTS